MQLFAGLLVGLAIGALAATVYWLGRQRSAESSVARLEAELAASRQSVEDQREALTAALDGSRTVFVWEDRQPVSMAEHAGPTPNGSRVGRVYTPPRFRGNGYASACVAELSQHLLRLGYRYCFLFTDLANPTANRIYQRIGYQPVVDADEFVFEGARIRG